MANDNDGPPPPKRPATRQSMVGSGSYIASSKDETQLSRPTLQMTTSTGSNSTTADLSGGFNFNPSPFTSSTQQQSAIAGSARSVIPRPVFGRLQGSRSTTQHLNSQIHSDYSPTTPPRPTKSNSPTGIRRQSSSAPTYGNSWFTVSVGASEAPTLFTLHQNLASKESAFIKAALRGEWKESKEKVIRLPEHEPEHFQLFSHWIYDHAIFSAQEGGEKDALGIDKEWDRLARAWVLGSYLQALDFKDAVVGAIIEKATHNLDCRQYIHEIIYSNSHFGAPIRRLLADIASWRWNRFDMCAQSSRLRHSDFFYDLSMALMHRHDSPDSATAPMRLRDACSYHEHGLHESECYRAKCK